MSICLEGQQGLHRWEYLYHKNGGIFYVCVNPLCEETHIEIDEHHGG